MVIVLGSNINEAAGTPIAFPYSIAFSFVNCKSPLMCLYKVDNPSLGATSLGSIS